MAALRAGAANADMTPPLGIELAGYWKPRVAERVNTPLMAHALVLDDDATRLAFVALDLIALPADQADRAKERIAADIGIAPANVLIACSHTHEAPYPCPLLGQQTGADPDYMAKVGDAVVDAVGRAAAGVVGAEIGFASKRVPDICRNRRRLKPDGAAFNCWALTPEERETLPAAGPVDEELHLLAVREASGAPLAMLWNFTLHAHVFGSVPGISADYPHFTWRKVEEALGREFVSLYTAGACGDINRRASAEPDMIVDRLAAAIVEMYEGMTFTPEARLGAVLQTVNVPLRDFSEFQEEEIRRKLPHALATCREEWEILRAAAATSVDTSLQAVAIGDLALACVPGEYFCALGLDIKKRSPFATTMVVELANDYVGYIPTSAAFDQGGYELFNVRSSKVARGVGERMADELVGMLAGLRAGDNL